jgi:hypothetical protein
MIKVSKVERIQVETAVVSLEYFPGICLEVLRKVTENLRWHSLWLSRDLNRAPSDDLTIEVTCLVARW